ncbi:hypothetical protein TREMEDRAFT_27701 [Tremella mesenterica DSM 1558]|uniref:uncharacterized protein n=1 Tax=Tremella mesenterica (strain ATCC 24925 / CBS 8224 / DSM 1558 / NBRC 9311 / NRRL Y-6157 / RJB 2259-6 / UBC 559-6) TaxID=578456 RepID=UPI0003F49BE8|nr:uncharacterized protein TREMEDRAFT_27701 [Tremella mesenterica DSM 1558]EIW71021.1 hypothetical protein TREMEDRAFT_27701 [Tremella mesenterica DSM 1558]
MGLLQSRPSPTPPPSLPSIGPTQSQPRGPLSYFSIHSPPDTSHTHDLPTSTDTTLVSHYLTHKGLPEDVVDRILGLAEFWSPCRRHCGREICVIAGTLISRRGGAWRGNREEEEDRVRDAWSLDRRGEVWFLSSEPIGCSHLFEGRKEKIWVWKIVVDTLSKDQGWSSSGQHYGTYQQCYSWFEVSLWRDGREVEGSRCSIQSNVHAGQYFKSHRNVLGPSHSLVQQAKQGDRVMLWARARYPGWRNHVREASITIYTAPFPPSV